MDSNQEKAPKKDTPPESDPTKVNRSAPAASEISPGVESVRDDRPASDGGAIVPIDEEIPSLTGN